MLFEKGIKGKNKRQVDLGIRDYYTYYKTRSKTKGRKPIDLKLFCSIVKEFNTLLRDEIVLKNEVIKLPYRLGYLGVLKYEVTFNPEYQYRWKVDYQKSKENGFWVYYDQPYRYKWKWYKLPAKVMGKKSYQFIPCRTASRLIAKALRENSRLDYCHKLI